MNIIKKYFATYKRHLLIKRLQTLSKIDSNYYWSHEGYNILTEYPELHIYYDIKKLSLTNLRNLILMDSVFFKYFDLKYYSCVAEMIERKNELFYLIDGDIEDVKKIYNELCVYCYKLKPFSELFDINKVPEKYKDLFKYFQAKEKRYANYRLLMKRVYLLGLKNMFSTIANTSNENLICNGIEYQKFFYFWGGFFSNWYKATIEIDGVEYNCVEQYMMAQKAIMFDDKESLKLIMATDNPSRQKRLGRKVANFNQDKWQSKCKEIVKAGVMAKFESHGDLFRILEMTQGCLLVEASPHDQVWGIGIDSNDAADGKSWNGTNLLGQILTEVREELMALSKSY